MVSYTHSTSTWVGYVGIAETEMKKIIKLKTVFGAYFYFFSVKNVLSSRKDSGIDYFQISV
jgi:hypothetical protein